MIKRLLFTFLLLLSELLAEGEMGCSISSILEAPTSTVLEEFKESNCTEDVENEVQTTTAITETLTSLKVLHEDKEIVIERENKGGQISCPPFCIEPMHIQGVKTVAELEVLDFIDTLKERKARLLIDIRENKFFVQGTIPGAINLPHTMLDDKSKYQKEVLTLLGGVYMNKKWSFKNAQSLLIFGDSATSPEASNTIKKLLELAYPSAKLLYYRSGISSWKALGLTVI